MKNKTHIGLEGFQKINWLPVAHRVDQCIAVTTYNFKSGVCPEYMSDLYSSKKVPNIRTRRSENSLTHPNYFKNSSRKALSYLGPKIWNKLDQGIKASISPSPKPALNFTQTCFEKKVFWGSKTSI